MVTLFLNCGMRLAELVGMNLEDIDLPGRQIRLFGKGHKERMVYLNDACVQALDRYLGFPPKSGRSLSPGCGRTASPTGGWSRSSPRP